MKKEYRYFLSVVAIALLSIFSLILLINKYASLTLEHVIETCNRIITNLFVSGIHYIGFILTILITLSLITLFARVVFSYIKTRKILGVLLGERVTSSQSQLVSLLKKRDIPKHALLIINVPEDIAITINWFNPRIVLSTGLINRLPAQALESVVLHEYYHLKNKHPFLLVVSELLTASIFFIPILKDINKQFRSILEDQADRFVRRIQKDSVPLELALSKVKNTYHFPLFPSFSRRNDYHYNRKNVIISLAVVLTGSILLTAPVQTHAELLAKKQAMDNCSTMQCSLDCVNF
ncbi:M56 family metallopeptidase [Candidatus Roizmanbacteria bacterium]|nr:M56 family metallopeptidase [Candidatus Roizmanbacteria bacterium]